MTRLIIIENEYSPRQMLREKLEQHFPDMEIVAESENAEDALIAILRLCPDLPFLDIRMPGKNGLRLADELMRMKGETFTPPDAVNEDKLLKFKSNNGLFLFHPDDIVYVEADRDYACMFFANGTKEDIFERLGKIEKKLPPELFRRTGKSIIINRKYIRKIADKTLQLVTPSACYVVEISRNAIRQLKSDLLKNS